MTKKAAEGLERCRLFLKEKNIQAAKRAALIIDKKFLLLEKNPVIGRPLSDMPELRELIIEFGDSGYLALYKHNPSKDNIYLLAFRHQKEMSY